MTITAAFASLPPTLTIDDLGNLAKVVAAVPVAYVPGTQCLPDLPRAGGDHSSVNLKADTDHQPLRRICNDQLLGTMLSGFQFK